MARRDLTFRVHELHVPGRRYLDDVRRFQARDEIVEPMQRSEKPVGDITPRCAIALEPDDPSLCAEESHPFEMTVLQAPIAGDDDPSSLGDIGDPDSIRSTVRENLLLCVDKPAALLQGIHQLANHVGRIEKVGEARRIKLRQLRVLARS